jgi:diguanylate cyclase (GGDEF)-like protein/PAS domain S-box-containing protein
MFIIYTGIIAGVHNSYALFPSVFAGFMFPATLPLLLHLLHHQEYILSLIFTIYLVTMFRSSYRVSQFLKEKTRNLLINTDIMRENTRLHRSITEENEQKEKVLQGAELGYWDWYPQSSEHQVSSRWLEIIGATRDDIAADEKDWQERIHPDDRLSVMLQIEEAIENKSPYIVQFRMRHKAGHYVWIEGSGAVVEWDDEGRALRLSGTHKDISEQKQLQKVFEEQRIHLKAIFDLNPNITIISSGQALLNANYAFFELFSDYEDLEAFIHKHECICNLFELVDHPDYLHPSKGNWVEAASLYRHKQARIIHKGKAYNFDVIGKKVTFTEGVQYIITFNDTTERYNLQRQLEEKAIKDPMTGLYNRRHYNQAMESMLATAGRLKGKLGFIMFDIDNFKKYNDNYGHDKGDEALIKTARIIKECFTRTSDVVCRLGGEEFGVIVTDMDEAELMRQAKMICRRVYDAGIVHEHNNALGVVSISVGLSWCDFTQSRKSADTLYKEADIALYASKTAGRNRVTVYCDELEQVSGDSHD